MQFEIVVWFFVLFVVNPSCSDLNGPTTVLGWALNLDPRDAAARSGFCEIEIETKMNGG